MTLSSRARALLKEPSPLVKAHFRCAADPFDAQRNPDGYINFGTAENHLMWDLVEPLLHRASAVSERQAHYDFLFGSQRLRQRVAALLSETARRPIATDSVIVTAGASAALDLLGFALGDEGDAVIVPTPYYAGFDHDLKARAGLAIVPAPLTSAEGFALTPEVVARALSDARAQGLRVRAVLVTSPHNPLGTTLDREALEALVSFMAEQELEGVFDEIYAHSNFAAPPFVSVRALGTRWQDHLHVVYGFAKDFGLSGFKVGVIQTESTAVRDAARELALFSSVSTLTQHVLAEMLGDAGAVKNAIAVNKARLRRAYGLLTERLDQAGVPYLPSNAGLFLWIDLGSWLTSRDAAGEHALFERVFAEAKVSITPSAAFHGQEPGWFRLCFAWPDEVLLPGVERLLACLIRPGTS